jgi:MtN3 and saliva related transmembrane protein
MKDYVGAAATIICVLSVTPQVYQVIKTNSTRDISLASIFLMIIMSALWIWYGILIMDWPVILTDVGVVLQEFVILVYKIKHVYFANNDPEA